MMYKCPHLDCSNRTEFGYCKTTVCIYPTSWLPNTVIGYVPTEPKTNADRIRSMTDEELAEFIEGACCPPVCYTKHFDECQKEDCVPCWLAWLKKEVET